MSQYDDLLENRVSRRSIFRGAAALGAGAMLSSLLVACAEDDDAEEDVGAAPEDDDDEEVDDADEEEVDDSDDEEDDGEAEAPSDVEIRTGEQLNFVGWQYRPEVVENNVGIFEELYDEDVRYELVAGEYHPIVETKQIGGEHLDMMYAEENYFERWYQAGWVRTIEDLPGATEMREGLYDAAVQSLTNADGELISLPYYMGHMAFLYNTEHTDQLDNFEPPETWEQVTEYCAELREKGISESPYLCDWGRRWPSLSWVLFGQWHSEGEVVFDENFDPTFQDGGVGFQKILEWNKMMWDENYIIADAIVFDSGEALAEWYSGRYTFMVGHDYHQFVMNDPELSETAGNVQNSLMPGSTHESYIWTAGYLMGAHADPERAWNLMQFFGGKAKDGEYHVIKRWALENGLGTGWREVMEDPEVEESMREWRDLDISWEQIDLSFHRHISKAIWFPEWDWHMMGRVQDYFQDAMTIDELIEDLYDKAIELKEMYTR